MSLPDYGWTEEQAQGLFERLNLDGGTPNWKREHLQRLRSWCSAHGKDPATVDGQLEFVVDDLCNTYERYGSQASYDCQRGKGGSRALHKPLNGDGPPLVCTLRGR
jgi:hypothetical protein